MDMASSSTATIVGSKATQHRKISDDALTWLQNIRHISRETLAKLPVASGMAWFGELERRSPAVFFGYPGGWKARAYPEKAFTSKPGGSFTFWNIEAVLNGPLEQVFITEGELDACALVEAGIPVDSVLAAPSASPSSDEGGLVYVKEALAAGLAKAKRFVWCGDQDDAGRQLRASMARIFGGARLNFVEWPEGAKDANDYLRSDGPQAVRDLLFDGQMPWPSDGLFRLSEIPDPPPLVCWHPGFDAWGNRMSLAAGTLSVATGHPGMGKTLLWGQIWFQVAHAYNLVACIASFETRPKPHMRRQLRTLFGRKLERHLDADERAAADKWIDAHYLFLVHPERRPDLRWLLDEAETAVVRHGAKIVQVDPWNRLEASRELRETETEYIGRCLRESYNFAADFNCHVQIIAHPSKTDSARRGDPPELEDIAGSKHWDNMVDQGFVVHRPRLFDAQGNRETYAELHHKKARFDELGFATKFGLDFDIDQGRYGTCELRQRKRKPKETEEENGE